MKEGKVTANPFYSVVIPLFNRADTITPVIQSVLEQSWQDFEIIVVDDGSSDNPKPVIDRLADRRITYTHQTNGGGSKARNTGMQAAKGRYIAFLDSDDFFLKDHLKNAKALLEKQSNTCTYTQVKVNRGDGLFFLKPHRALLAGEHISDYLMADRGFVQTSTLIIPRELTKFIQFDESINFGQDTDFAIKICAAGYKLEMLEQPGAIWNDIWSASRLSSVSRPEQRLQWLNRMRPHLTQKAYWADKGWPEAKGFAYNGQKTKGLSLFFGALVRGYYRPKIALVAFLQVLLSKQSYRKLSDLLAKLGFQP
jgi:glycosyltransferase involved in cell wall biosynthesis